MVNVTIKNIPEDLVQRLRERARQHHRSVQGEVLAILEDAVDQANRRMSDQEFRDWEASVDEFARDIAEEWPPGLSGTDAIRQDRDARV